MVVLPETDLLSAQKIAEDLRLHIEKEAFDIGNNQSINISVSIGLSAYPIHGNKISVLLDIADKRMYEAKKGGDSKSSRKTIFDEQDNKVAIFPGKRV